MDVILVSCRKEIEEVDSVGGRSRKKRITRKSTSIWSPKEISTVTCSCSPLKFLTRSSQELGYRRRATVTTLKQSLVIVHPFPDLRQTLSTLSPICSTTAVTSHQHSLSPTVSVGLCRIALPPADISVFYHRSYPSADENCLQRKSVDPLMACPSFSTSLGALSHLVVPICSHHYLRLLFSLTLFSIFLPSLT